MHTPRLASLLVAFAASSSMAAPLAAQDATGSDAPPPADDAAPAPAPPPPATLLVTVNVDGASVTIDGQEVGTSPVAPIELGEGRHEVSIAMPGYRSVRRQEPIAPGERARIDVVLQPLGAQPTLPLTPGSDEASGPDLLNEWWFWAAIGGAAAVVLGVAIGIGVAVADDGGSQPHGDPRGIMLPRLTGGL